MNHCETCKHWNGPKKVISPRFDEPGWGDCLMISSDLGGGAESARSMDHEGFSSLETRYDFGCTLWEPGEGIGRCGNCQGAYTLGTERHVFFGLGSCEIVSEGQD